MTFREIGRAALFLAALGSLAPSGRAQDERRIPMDGTVNGHPVHLAFDSGAEAALVLLAGKAEQIGLKIIPPAAGVKAGPGEVIMGMTEPATVEIAGKSFRRAQFNVLKAPPSINWDVDGVVGWRMFKDYIVSFELADKKVTIGLEQVPAEAASWTKLRLRTDRDILVMELTQQSGKPRQTVLIDTGDSAGVSLSPEKWREWKAAHPQQPVTLIADYTPGAGLVVSEEAWADELSLEGLVLHGVPVRESNLAQAHNAGPAFAAVLGISALMRLDLVIDGKAGVLYAHPRTDLPWAYPHNRLGAVFVPSSDQSDELVAHVAAGSPAATAGIRDGDVLLKFDDVDVTKWRTDPSVRPFTKYAGRDAGTKLVVTLRRGKETVVATAILQEIVGPR